MRPLINEDLVWLEQLVDAAGLGRVLDALGVIASEKAAHIQENWQDGRTAGPWRSASNSVQRVSLLVLKLGI